MVDNNKTTSIANKLLILSTASIVSTFIYSNSVVAAVNPTN